jgi:ankyrin repeat protein
MINLLIEKGADIHAKAFRGYTPLHCGIRRFDSVRALLQAGADPNVHDMMGLTPLHLSTATGCDECVKVDTPGDITSGTPIIPSMLSEARSFGTDTSTWDQTGITADTYTLSRRGIMTINCLAGTGN